MIDKTETALGLNALVLFKAENVGSYRDEVELSLLGTRLSMDTALRELPLTHSTKPVRVLPTAGLFGANASGKSRLLQAMADMRRLVVTSFRRGGRETGMYRRPFLLDDISRESSSRFHIELILRGVRWNYGFCVNDERVVEEYAFHYPKGREALVFYRHDTEVTTVRSTFRALVRDLERLAHENVLFLSIAGAIGDETLSPLFGWFSHNLLLADVSSRGYRAAYTAELASDTKTRESVLSLLRAADLGITGIERVPADPELLDRMQRALRILNETEDSPESDEEQRLLIEDMIVLTHQGSSSNAKIEPGDESAGTMVWVSLIGPVLKALSSGKVLLVDELDNSLHPHLVRRLVELFQDRDTNRHCAQLVFNAHDVSLLDGSMNRLLGRDQIWITEKDNEGATTLHSLAEYKLRRDDPLEHRYLRGRLGGIPDLDEAQFERAIELIDT